MSPNKKCQICTSPNQDVLKTRTDLIARDKEGIESAVADMNSKKFLLDEPVENAHVEVQSVSDVVIHPPSCKY